MRYAGKEQWLAHSKHSGKVWTKKTFSITWAFLIICCAPWNNCSRMFTLIPTLEEYLLRNSIKDLHVSRNQYFSYGRTWVVTWRKNNSICIVLYNSSSKFIAVPSFNQSTTTWERLFRSGQMGKSRLRYVHRLTQNPTGVLSDPTSHLRTCAQIWEALQQCLEDALLWQVLDRSGSTDSEEHPGLRPPGFGFLFWKIKRLHYMVYQQLGQG